MIQHGLSKWQLSYASPNDGDNNCNDKTNTPSNMQNPHEENVNNCSINMCPSQGFNISSIPYGDKLLDLSECWDGLNHLISIFGTRETLVVDNNNIVKSLLRIVEYIYIYI